jgi:hypothetical protein
LSYEVGGGGSFRTFPEVGRSESPAGVEGLRVGMLDVEPFAFRFLSGEWLVMLTSSDEAVVGRDLDGLRPLGNARIGETSLLVGDAPRGTTGVEAEGAGIRDCLVGEGVRGESVLR